MSQTLFNVCLFAGLLAMASAQSWNWQSCSKSMRTEIDRYRESVMKSTQKFSNSMQDTAGQAADMSALQKDIDKMTQSISSLADMSNNFDMGRVTSVYMDNMQTMVSIGRNAFRPALVSGSMGSYMELVNTLMSSNTQFVQTVTDACMPANRRT